MKAAILSVDDGKESEQPAFSVLLPLPPLPALPRSLLCGAGGGQQKQGEQRLRRGHDGDCRQRPAATQLPRPPMHSGPGVANKSLKQRSTRMEMFPFLRRFLISRRIFGPLVQYYGPLLLSVASNISTMLLACCVCDDLRSGEMEKTRD